MDLRKVGFTPPYKNGGLSIECLIHDRWTYKSQVVLGHDWTKNHLKSGLATKGMGLGMMTLGHPY
jgi:hypothetical protein